VSLQALDLRQPKRPESKTDSGNFKRYRTFLKIIVSDRDLLSAARV
jgi:hypothetical protein